MSKKEYGGYLPLELSKQDTEYYKKTAIYDVLRLNSGRSAFFYAAIEANINTIYLPFFTCKDTSQPFEKLGIEIKYYFLDDDLLPKNIKVGDKDFMFWTNYYGNATHQHKEFINENYKNLVIDNCHAFFSKPNPLAYNCYSTRKFFGVSDGAYLINKKIHNELSIPKDTSYKNIQHLIKQIDLGINDAYKENLNNEKRLCDDFKRMSSFTEKLLKTFDYSNIKKIRRKNFLLMNNSLGDKNHFPINTECDTHMYYPFLTNKENLRHELVKKYLYNPFWWKHVLDLVPENSIEYHLSKYTVMLPIDQRYNEKDIYDICELVESCLEKC